MHARREVILSAGSVHSFDGVHIWTGSHKHPSAIKTPQLLELSGIGRPNVLEKIGVQCKVDLAGVGENVQGRQLLLHIRSQWLNGTFIDHLLYGITYEIAMSHETFDRMFDPEYATDALDN